MITIEQCAGLVAATLASMGKNKVTDIASTLQEYLFLGRLMKDDKIETHSGGKNIQFYLTASLGSNARNVGLFSVDRPNVGDSNVEGEVPWRHSETSYSFDRLEPELNSGDSSRIYDHVKLRKAREMAGLAELAEGDFWGTVPGSDDDVTPFGLQYYIVKTTGKTDIDDCGFNGGDPAGYAAGCAGLLTATYPGWKNWAGNYTNMTQDDLIKKMRKLQRQTAWKSPIKFPDYDETSASVADRWQIYVNGDTQEGMNSLGDAQNENLGRDLGGAGVTFNGSPIIYVPYLDDASDNPIYFVNWNVFCIAMLKGEKMRDTTKASPTQHNVVNVFTDVSWQSLCRDRRKCGVLTQE